MFAALVYLSYLPYFPYTDWFFLRFMLPAIAALYVLAGGVASRWIGYAPARARWLVVIVLLAVTAGVQLKQTYDKDIAVNVRWTYRTLAAARYLAETLPENALVITFYHSGTVRHYTGRPVLSSACTQAGTASSFSWIRNWNGRDSWRALRGRNWPGSIGRRALALERMVVSTSTISRIATGTSEVNVGRPMSSNDRRAHVESGKDRAQPRCYGFRRTSSQEI